MCLGCTVVEVLERGAPRSTDIHYSTNLSASGDAVVGEKGFLAWISARTNTALSKPMTTKERT